MRLAISDIRTTSALTSENLVFYRFEHALERPLRLAKVRSWTQGALTGFSQGMMFATYTLAFW